MSAREKERRSAGVSADWRLTSFTSSFILIKQNIPDFTLAAGVLSKRANVEARNGQWKTKTPPGVLAWSLASALACKRRRCHCVGDGNGRPAGHLSPIKKRKVTSAVAYIRFLKITAQRSVADVQSARCRLSKKCQMEQ